MTTDQSALGMTSVAARSADLLPDWYDDWVPIEAEDWRQLRLHALEVLAGRLMAADRWGEAAGAAARRSRSKSARAVLIQVHPAEGNQSEAGREFARYRALPYTELGLDPTSRLQRLIQGLLTS